jgi:hypothetical protein
MAPGGDAGHDYDGVDPTAHGAMNAGPVNESRAASYEYGDPEYGCGSHGSVAGRNT